MQKKKRYNKCGDVMDADTIFANTAAASPHICLLDPLAFHKDTQYLPCI